MRPKLIHFVDLDGTKLYRTKDLDLLQYLALRSAHAVNPDHEVLLHCDYVPHGLFWGLVRRFTRTMQVFVKEDPRFRNVERVEHKSDLLRLLILKEHGGIYLDTDVVCVKSFDGITSEGVVMGKEQRLTNGQVSGLCNAVILAPKGAEFIDLWLDAYEGFHNYQWSEFSVQTPWALAQKNPESIQVEPVESFFYPTGWPEGVYSLFRGSDEYPGAYTFHLWRSLSRPYVDSLMLEKIFLENTTLNNAVRPYVVEDFRFTPATTAAGLLSGPNTPRSGRLLEMVFRNTRMTVQSGPFTGIRLAQRAMRGDGDLCAKLLGSYEKELHSVIMRATQRTYDAIVNIGSGDGFYAIGLAKLFGDIPVYAYDHGEMARGITAENSILNGLSHRIQTGVLLDTEGLIEIALVYGRLLVFSDIEGDEKEILGDERVARALDSCDLIIETYDSRDRMITPAIWEKYGQSHKIEVIHHEGRDPNATVFLGNIAEIERWQALCEYREATQHWLFCSSRNPYGHLLKESRNQIMTTHGTVVYVDDGSGHVRHGLPHTGTNNLSLLSEGLSGRMIYERGGFRYSVVCQSDMAYAVNSDKAHGRTIFEIVELDAEIIGLRVGDTYLSAESDGSISLSKPHCCDRERFQRLPF
jgi:hypothetical protein